MFIVSRRETTRPINVSTVSKRLRQVSKLRAAAHASVMLAALLMHDTASAQQAMPAASGASTRFPVSGFEVTGDNPLKPEDSARVLAPFIGPDATLVTLQQASAALDAELKRQGFAMHRVTLPAQEMGNKVTLNIVRFVIGKVTVEGISRYSEANIRASVPELREGEAPDASGRTVEGHLSHPAGGRICCWRIRLAG